MSADFRLVTLDCPHCGAPLAGEDEDLVFYCTACYSGFRVPEEIDRAEEAAGEDDLLPVEVSFLASPAQAPDLYLPFWLLPARIEIFLRHGTGGFVDRVLDFFSGPKDGGLSREGTFAVPAFRSSLGGAVKLAQRYSSSMPATGELPRERLVGGNQTVADAHTLAEFVLISSEVEKPDTLLELEYALEFGAPRLLGVPFLRHLDLKRDVFFGLVA